jgi:S-formylglutathione hydrolase FrmB
VSAPVGATGELELLAEEWLSDRLCRLVLRSPSLSRPAEVRVIVPPGAPPAAPGASAAPVAPAAPGAPAAARPPLLLLLHGADDTPAGWDHGVHISARCVDLAALVVMPAGGEIGFCTDWVHRERPVRGRIGTRWAGRIVPDWERFHLSELLPWVTARYGASERRVVLGISMGGHGAIAYTARHPGTFVAAASFSGVLDTLGPGIPSMLAAALLRHRQHRHALWGSPITRRSRWEAHNPLDLAEALHGVPLYLARGDGKPFAGDPELGAGAAWLERRIGTCTDAMALRLGKLGIAATVSQGRGVHDWPTWDRELDLAWPFLLRGLGLDPAGSQAA